MSNDNDHRQRRTPGDVGGQYKQVSWSKAMAQHIASRLRDEEVVSKVTGNSAPADSAGDQGIGRGIANINLGPVAPGAVNGGIFTVPGSR